MPTLTPEDELGVLDHVPVGVMVLKPDFQVAFWNRVLEDWTGIGRTEVLGEPLAVHLPHLLEPKYARRVQAIFEGGPPAIFSSQLHRDIVPSPRQRGDPRAYHTTVTPLERGDETWALFAIQDVTELTTRSQQCRAVRDQALAEVAVRTGAQERLQRQLEFETLVRTVSSNLIYLRAELLDDAIHEALLMIGAFNDVQRSSLLALEPQGLIAKVTHTVVPPGSGSGTTDAELDLSEVPFFAAKLRGLRSVHVPDIRALELVEERQWMEARGVRSLLYVPIASRRELAGLLAFESFDRGRGWSKEDIRPLRALGEMLSGAVTRVRIETALRRNEESQRSAARQLSDANEELERFGYSVSHDLRAPLRAMEGFAVALREDYGPELDPTAHDYIARIVDGAQRLDTLISDLLAYSRLSQAQISRKPVSLDRVVEDAMARVESERAGDVVTTDISSSLPPVLGDVVILTQVITNLLSNAMKFRAPDRAPLVRLYAERTNDQRIRLCVEDNGIGIESKYHARVFRVFERLHDDNEFPGTGIGLAIVRRGVERLGGVVGVEAATPHGCRFWVELPEADD